MQTRPNLDRFVVRVGDAEREAVLNALSAHHSLGRLSVEELDRRQNAALAAVTEADLAKLVADLPKTSPQNQLAGPTSAPGPRSGWRQRDDVEALVRWGPPTAATLAGAAWVATAGPFPEEGSKFVMAMGMAVLGFISHWWVSRRRG
jgi:hypothetical protein